MRRVAVGAMPASVNIRDALLTQPLAGEQVDVREPPAAWRWPERRSSLYIASKKGISHLLANFEGLGGKLQYLAHNLGRSAVVVSF